MNELLQRHGCSNVFTAPEGLKELMADISREVLRTQPEKIPNFIAKYLSVLLLTREHGALAARLLSDLCDCRATVTEHLLQLGLRAAEADFIAEVIQQELEGPERWPDEKIKELDILNKILTVHQLDEQTSAAVCQVIRLAYRDYFYRKETLQEGMQKGSEEPWQAAAERTLELYKKTRPSFHELNRATERIQAAYRGYYVRKGMQHQLRHKNPPVGPEVELPGPPLDLAKSREIDLGPVIKLKVAEDKVDAMLAAHEAQHLNLPYDPTKTLTAVQEPPRIVSDVSTDPGGDESYEEMQNTRIQFSRK